MDELKASFKSRFSELLEQEEQLSALLDEVFKHGTAYVVGGYLRDILQSLPSRDIDFIVELDGLKLNEIVNSLGARHTTNRYGGIKLELKTISADFWSLKDNWAFKNKVVKLNEEDKLNSIAKGCFYNFDSLVINVYNYSYNVRNFNKYRNQQELDILQKIPRYKNLNPTVEANIIRAVYLKYKYNVSYSDNTLRYLIEKLMFLRYRYRDEYQRLLDVKQSYSKYSELNDEVFVSLLNTIRESTELSNQLYLTFDSSPDD